jgi:HK97 family phage prohead protease
MSEHCSSLTCSYEIKSQQDNVASFTGVASTNEIDQHNDVIEAGAFLPIARKLDGNPDVLMLRDHDRSQVIGGWKSFTQQNHQLIVEGELCLEVEKARETYALLKRGYLGGLSVGFNADKDGVTFDQKSGRRTVKRAILKECSIVAFPANKGAQVYSVKAELDDWLVSRGMPPDDIALLISEGFGALLDRYMKEDDPLKPWGDVEYADPGYQEDRVKRYPIHRERNIRAAWSYIHMPRNRAFYTREQLKRIEGRIIAAWKRKIDPAGPPAYQEAAAADDLDKKDLILGIDDNYPVDETAIRKEATELLTMLRGKGYV